MCNMENSNFSTKRILNKNYHLLLLGFLCFILLPVILSGCYKKQDSPPIEDDPIFEQRKPSPIVTPDGQEVQETQEIADPIPHSFINSQAMTLEDRINPPEGFSRIQFPENSFATFIRKFPLKEDGSEVYFYDGRIKPNQEKHLAIFDIDIGERDLQQCADSIIRMYAEYYWAREEYDEIAFHLTNGFLMEYTKWRDGNRIFVDGNNVSWNHSSVYDDSYESFRKYLDMVFAYAGTLSLSEESFPIEMDMALPGDMFLEGGSPGHCLLIIDFAENQQGEQCFLLAQGYMPAQDFHVLKNPKYLDDPWYYVSEVTYPLTTPSWTFPQDSLVRWFK